MGQIAAGRYFTSGTVIDAPPPLWLLAMRAQFATTFRFSLRTVVTRPIRAALFGGGRRPNRIPRGRTAGGCHPVASPDARPAPPLNQLGHRPGRLLRRRASAHAGTKRASLLPRVRGVEGSVRRLVVGCGYLGERVARFWRDAGDDVYATTRGDRADALSRAGLRPLKMDVTHGPALGPLPVVDTVVFAVGRDRRSRATMLDVHVTGLRSLLDTLPVSTGCVIYVSSTGVYGQDAGEWVDEESVCEPLSEGGKACLSGERLLVAHARGRDALVLRLAGLYGPGRVPRSADVTAGRPIAGSPDAYLNLIHVEDAAAAVVAAAASGPLTGRTYVVSDGHPPTCGEYAGWLATQLGVPPPVFEAGSGLGKRVRNARAVHELGLRLKYLSYREGLAAVRG